MIIGKLKKDEGIQGCNEIIAILQFYYNFVVDERIVRQV
jgi:hypothetical protein